MIDIRVGRLAQQLGVHRNTISNWIRNGKLKATPTVGKRYLISKEEFIHFCDASGIPEATMAAILAPAAPVAQSTPTQPAALTPMKSVSKNPIGSVMVVGGGIAGIQASLDLANSGYAVHLIERSPGIGGVMAQLDKTYPTNDCAM
jgi:excisionase family DNA binding protein